MKAFTILFASTLLLLTSSCVPVSSGLPENQPTMMRLHRATPTEDFQESERTRGGGLIDTSGGDWNF